MKIKSIYVYLLVFVVAVCVAAQVSKNLSLVDAATPPHQAKPNIVLIVSDDQRADAASCMPTVQARLAQQGVTFTNTFSSTPLCCPSRTSILTGKYAHNHGVIQNSDIENIHWADETESIAGGVKGFKKAGNEERILPKWLQEAGYRTGFYGKYLNGYGYKQEKTFPQVHQTNNEVPPYWNDWHAFPEPHFFNFQLVERSFNAEKTKRVCYLSSNYLKNKHYVEICQQEANEIVNDGRENYSTDVIKEKLIDFIRDSSQKHQPFFAYFAPKAPHSPYVSPARYQPDPKVWEFTDLARSRLETCSLFNWSNRPPTYLEKDISQKPEWLTEFRESGKLIVDRLEEDRQGQLVSALATDDAIGEILDVLEQTNQAENTIVIYTSDNGYAWGEHWWHHKNCAYEECSRVPLIVYDPRHPTTGRQDSAMVMNIDIAPTIAELTDTKIPAENKIDGMSLAVRLQDANTEWPRERVLTECWGPTNDWRPDTHVAVRTVRWKYIEHYTDWDRKTIKTRSDGRPEVELYDLKKDPYEQYNLLKMSNQAISGKGYTPQKLTAVVSELKPKLQQMMVE